MRMSPSVTCQRRSPASHHSTVASGYLGDAAVFTLPGKAAWQRILPAAASAAVSVIIILKCVVIMAVGDLSVMSTAQITQSTSHTNHIG